VIALDLLPSVEFKGKNIRYIEVPDRDFSCYGVDENSVDFCWSFGVFCHLSIDACRKYVKSIFSKLVSNGEVALYFSNNDRRPLPENHPFMEDEVQWVKNNFSLTESMLKEAGFVDIKDLMPDLFDTMIYGRKP
jgi:cyclopropane fatty-acyl-phospholipid synthase-like methyltransferase